MHSLNFLMDVAIKIRANLTDEWAVRGSENQKLYRKNKKYFQEILNPGDGRIGVAWEYPDTSVRDFNLILTFQNINSYLLEHRTDTVKLGTRGSINHISNSKKILPQ